MRLFSVMARGSDVTIRLLAEGSSRMVVVTELLTTAIIYYQQPDCCSYVTITQTVQVIEHRQIAYEAKMEVFRISQCATYQRRNAAIYAKATRIRERGIRRSDFKEIPRTQRV